MSKVECPDCGGPAKLAPSGKRILWHPQWHVGRGGRLYQSGTMCTPTTLPVQPEVAR